MREGKRYSAEFKIETIKLVTEFEHDTKTAS
jgi:hypothetical protein